MRHPAAIPILITVAFAGCAAEVGNRGYGSYSPTTNPLVNCYMPDGGTILTSRSGCAEIRGRLARTKPPQLAKSPAIGTSSTGSGLFINTSGNMLTNAHVVNSCSRLIVVVDGIEASALVVAEDPSNDLAALTVRDAQPDNYARFRSGTGVRPGDPVLVTGYPLSGLLASEASVAVGNISALAGIGNDTRLMQLTAPVQPGNSGGPVIDMSGLVVGIVMAKLDALKVARVTGDVPQNINFAVKSQMATGFLDANGIPYSLASPSPALSPADAAEDARRFTHLVKCYR